MSTTLTSWNALEYLTSAAEVDDIFHAAIEESAGDPLLLVGVMNTIAAANLAQQGLSAFGKAQLQHEKMRYLSAQLKKRDAYHATIQSVMNHLAGETRPMKQAAKTARTPLRTVSAHPPTASINGAA